MINYIITNIHTRLWSLFGQSLFEALDLVDNGKVTLLSSSSGRQIIQVDHRASNHELPLLCMVDANFCTCHNYKFHGKLNCLFFKQLNLFVVYYLFNEGIGKEEFILCKHLIASKIAVALNGCKREVISNDEMKNIIKRNFYD